ncbi:MAG: IS3 family transposase [Nitrospira sp.]
MGKQAIYTLYRQEGLQLRSKRPRRRKMVQERVKQAKVTRTDQTWAMDFVADQLVNGNSIRMLTVIDIFTREALAISVGRKLGAKDVVETLNQLVMRRGAPGSVCADNGAEFAGRLTDPWAYHHKVRLNFSRPGKPTDNGHVESFNGSLRDECLNVHWFETLDEARRVIEAWRIDFKESRPHMAHKGVSPGEFARRYRDSEKAQGGSNAEN